MTQQIVHGHFTESKLNGEDSKRVVIQTIRYLDEVWHKKEEHEYTYLFMAVSFLCDNKTARESVAEWWLNHTPTELVDQATLGRITGTLLATEYAPLKRLTDNLSERMYNMGNHYDNSLHTLLGHMMIHMSDEPIKNTKKLLQLYSELSLKYKLSHTTDLQAKLTKWAEKKSLKALVGKVLK